MDFENIAEDLLIFIVDKIGKILALKVNSQIWPDAKYFVEALLRTDMSGIEKHTQVKEQLYSLFGEDLASFTEIASTLLDIFIKLAYLHCKLQ